VLFEPLPLFAAEDALLLVEVLLCFWLWFPPCNVLLFVFAEFPELDTPLLLEELPPVALAPDVDEAPEVLVLFEVLFEVVGVVGSVGGVGVEGTQMNAIPSTTS
jgi:hypothetical protein